MTIDNESPPGAWAREMRARGMYQCSACGWTGRQPSITDASSIVERNGRMEMDRTHLCVCPACFTVIANRETHASAAAAT